MTKETVVYPLNGMLFSNKKECIPDTHNGMYESRNNYAEYKRSTFKKGSTFCIFPLYKILERKTSL